MKKTVNQRLWANFILFGLVGQIAWTVENMYFNVFLYNTVTTDPTWIAWMVALSAVTATVTTLLIGALSDRVGSRKWFLVGGYILWGLVTMSFSGVSVDNVSGIFPNAANVVTLTAGIVILLDCVMTFFGSSANDAAFNAFMTDKTVPETRGRVEGVLQTLPLLAMLIVFGLLDPLTKNNRWSAFFILVGILTIVTGIVGIFLLPKESRVPSQEPWRENLVYGFRPAVVRGNPRLYLAFALLAVIGCATQVYMPYLIIYIQNFLGIGDYALLLGLVLLGASVLSVVAGRWLDRFGKQRAFPWVLIPACGGLILMYFARTQVLIAIAGIIFVGASLVLTAIAAALAKDYLPEGMNGRFQGIRMIFQVLLPMLIGPFVGSWLIRRSGQVYFDLGVEKQVPTPAIFVGAAVILLLALIPWFGLRRTESR